MIHLPRIFLAFFAALFLTLPLHAQPGWQELGPDGGEVTAFAQDALNPMNLYVGTSNRGVFLSRDGGESWQISGLEVDQPVLGLTVGPVENPGVWATAGSSIFASFDGGTTWESTGFPPVGSVRALVAGPEYLYAGNFRGLYRLEGSTWARIGERQGFDNGSIYELQITPDGALLLASIHGLFVSDDQGDNFQPLGTGVLRDAAHVVQEPDSTALYVSTFVPRAVYKSNAARTNWRNVTATLPFQILPQGFGLTVSGLGTTLYALTVQGLLYRSSDDGESWEGVGPAPQETYGAMALRTDLADGRSLLSLGTGGLARSATQGTTWIGLNQGLHIFELSDYALAAGPTATLFASAPGGTVFRSSGDFEVWSLVAQEDLSVEAPLAVDPTDASRVYRGVSGGVQRSSDGGDTWTRSETDLICSEVNSLAVAPSNPSTLYATSYTLTSGCPSNFPEACFAHRSLDGGVTWSCTAEPGNGLGLTFRLTVDPRDDQRVYALQRARLSRTDDGGDTWTILTDDLGTLFLDFVLDPVDPDIVYLAGEDGLFRSPDGGDTWVIWDLEPSPGPFTALAVHPTVPDNLYAVAGERTLWSTDIGRTWQELPGEASRLELRAPLRILEQEAHYLYSATEGAGVVRRIVPVKTECAPDAQTLCLGGAEGNRFEVSVSWEDFQGRTGQGQGLYLPNGPGAFWFFDQDNLEMAVKVLDGRPVNGHWWVFFGALTNVEFTLTVRDTATGQVREYFNPLRNFASRGDTRAFPGSGLLPEGDAATASSRSPGDQFSSSGWLALPAGALPSGGGSLPEGGCTANGTDDALALCLAERFLVRVTWRDFQDRTGTGKAIPLTDDTGSFWFFSPDNTEMLVKVLDGRPVNGHWWVFFGSLTNVEFTLTVEDVMTGELKTYVNPLRNFASRGDTRAFDG
ncbi:MAG: hypothetical protein SX243_10085 [Acidobacteriota bacterium]|nr:hypothetical protein [Acidobacteriota bacterium]